MGPSFQAGCVGGFSGDRQCADLPASGLTTESQQFLCDLVCTPLSKHAEDVRVVRPASLDVGVPSQVFGVATGADEPPAGKEQRQFQVAITLLNLCILLRECRGGAVLKATGCPVSRPSHPRPCAELAGHSRAGQVSPEQSASLTQQPHRSARPSCIPYLQPQFGLPSFDPPDHSPQLP